MFIFGISEEFDNNYSTNNYIHGAYYLLSPLHTVTHNNPVD